MSTRVTDKLSKAARRKWRPRRSPLGELYSDLNQLYRLHLGRRALGAGEVRMKTRRERVVILESAFREMHRSGLKLQRLKNFREKHVNHILSHWLSRSFQPGTLATYISHLRTFCTWLDKPLLVSQVDEFAAQQAHLLQRRTGGDAGEPRQGPDVNVVDVLSRARALDERVGTQLALIVVFGLRPVEAWLFRPHLAVVCNGRLAIWQDPQSGRERTLDIELTPARVAVLEWARSVAQTPWESMIPPGWTLQRWGRHFYYLCERLGLTRRQLGMTPRAIRHGGGPDLHAWLTSISGTAAPGHVPVQQSIPTEQDARSSVSENAEHCDVPTNEPGLAQKVSASDDRDEPERSDM